MDVWIGGWIGVKAFLRIAYNNEQSESLLATLSKTVLLKRKKYSYTILVGGCKSYFKDCGGWKNWLRKWNIFEQNWPRNELLSESAPKKSDEWMDA